MGYTVGIECISASAAPESDMCRPAAGVLRGHEMVDMPDGSAGTLGGRGARQALGAFFARVSKVFSYHSNYRYSLILPSLLC